MRETERDRDRQRQTETDRDRLFEKGRETKEALKGLKLNAKPYTLSPEI